MKPSVFAHTGWILFGGTLVLLIGALVKFDPDTLPEKTAPVAQTAPAVPEASDDTNDATNDLPLPPNFPANLAQIVKLNRAGLKGDVIAAYIQSSGEHYAPTADEIIYLHDAGVPEVVMAALVAPKPAASLPPPDAGTPQTDLAADAQPDRTTAVAQPAEPAPVLPPQHPPAGAPASYFYDDLAPYGDWLQTSDNTWAWQPTVEQAVPNWQPYRDDGQWQYTDSGWYWQSSYPWGWAAFHYGGWYNDPSRGWLWQPANTWAPAWVVWRKTPTHFGWAPLPPGVSFNAEFAVQPNNLADYGFTASSYTFVPLQHFLSHNLPKYAAPANTAAAILATSVTLNPRNRKTGFDPNEVATAVHRPIQRLVLGNDGAPSRGPAGNSPELAAYHPVPGISSSHQDSSSSKSTR